MAHHTRGNNIVKLKNFWRDRGIVLLVSIAFLMVFFGEFVSKVYLDKLWFESLGYSQVFWKKLLWEWGGRLTVGLFACVFIYVNLKLACKSVGTFRIRRKLGDLVISEELSANYLTKMALIISLVFGAWFGLVASSNLGMQILFTLTNTDWKMIDPIFGKDLSFFVINLPLLETLTGLLIGMVTLTLVSVTVTYVLSGVIGIPKGIEWTPPKNKAKQLPRKHLSSLGFILFMLFSGSTWLSRYGLLTNGSSSVQNIFGYTDYHARLPVLVVLTALTIVVAVSIFAVGFRNLKATLPIGISLLLVFGFVGGQAYPSFVQKFRVEPNELALEGKFIEDNIRFTRAGFDLTDLERKTFQYQLPDNGVDWSEAMQQFNGLPVWSAPALLTTYRQLEARFPYYEFFGATVDRYNTDNGVIPVALSVREILPSGIQDRNWQNVHIRDEYIKGNGIVASVASDRTPEGRPPMLISGIPPDAIESSEAPEELILTKPAVYVGSSRQEYAILNQNLSMETEANENDIGSHGIPLNSWLRTLATAWYFQDTNLLFSEDLTNESRLLFRRDVLTRVRHIAGSIIHFPEDPYPIVHEGGLLWILEGFTITDAFPLTNLTEFDGTGGVNYARNSVKVTVDAETGATIFYIVDEEDPLIDLYRRGFPGMFVGLEEMPSKVREHTRYSKSMLDLQARKLNQYHQETARVFHGQQDVWTLPQELSQNSSTVPYRSEYGIYKLPDEKDEAFLLTTAFVPRGRQNLTAILVAHNDPEDYGRLVLFEVPAQSQVPGPRQVEALIEQDPIISQQFSLWRTGGSQVWTGHIHLVPVGETLLYMEPVFLAAEEDAIPELRRFVVSDGYRVSMEPTLLEAIEALKGTGTNISNLEIVEFGDTQVSTVNWPREALEMLEKAEAAARDFDFSTFGKALQELRRLLQDLSLSEAL